MDAKGRGAVGGMGGESLHKLLMRFKIQTHYAACFPPFFLFAFYEGWVSLLLRLLELTRLIFLNKQSAWWFVTLLGYLGLTASLSGPAQLDEGKMSQLGWKHSMNK